MTESATVKRVAVIAAALSAFLMPFMGSSITIAQPSIGEEFAMDAVTLSWIATIYLLTAATCSIPLGKIADIYGRKRIFMYGAVAYTLSSLLCAMARAGWQIIAFRVIEGIGGAMIAGTGVAILTSLFPPGERGKVLGANVAATYLGLSLGPALGGVLTQQFGWRSIFYVNVPVGLLIIVLVLWKMKGEWAEAQDGPFDALGAVLSGGALAAVLYGFSTLPKATGVALTVGGSVGLLAFIWWETRAPNPILDMNLFRRSTVFAFSNLAALVNYSATYASAFLLSLYLQYIEGFTPQAAGMILVIRPVIMAAFSPLTGWLSDRIEPRFIASAGMALMVAGLLPLMWLGEGAGIGLIVFCLAVMGFGFALFSSPNTNAVMSSVAKRFYGVASATLGTMRLTGQAFSMGIVTLLFALVIGPVEITPAVYPALLSATRIAFGIFAVLCFGGTFASLARGKCNLADRQSTGKV